MKKKNAAWLDEEKRECYTTDRQKVEMYCHLEQQNETPSRLRLLGVSATFVE